MKLDTTKVYYLGDLSDEQLQEIQDYLNETNPKAKYLTAKKQREEFSHNIYLMCGKIENDWYFTSYVSENKEFTNALTLFTQTKDERIAQIQLRIQELNNELIDLDEEMRKLTYDKKEN